MKAVHAGLAAALVALLGASAPAQTLNDTMNRQADCELDHIRDTRSALAVGKIKEACNYLALDTSSMHPRQRGYALCLLRVVPGSQSDLATNEIISACRQRFPPD